MPATEHATLSATSLEVLLAGAALKQLVGDAFTDDMMDEIIRELNEKKKAA